MGEIAPLPPPFSHFEREKEREAKEEEEEEEEGVRKRASPFRSIASGKSQVSLGFVFLSLHDEVVEDDSTKRRGETWQKSRCSGGG